MALVGRELEVDGVVEDWDGERGRRKGADEEDKMVIIVVKAGEGCCGIKDSGGKEEACWTELKGKLFSLNWTCLEM
jgi:hypothetical protein